VGSADAGGHGTLARAACACLAQSEWRCHVGDLASLDPTTTSSSSGCVAEQLKLGPVGVGQAPHLKPPSMAEAELRGSREMRTKLLGAEI
jgi:hypothetical protein